MGKGNKNCDKEASVLQKLKTENKMLKRQLARIRKQLERVDLEHYENVKEIVDKHEKEYQEVQFQEETEQLEKRWKCFECVDGVMRLKILTRRDGLKYYRMCDCCSNRTKAKPYNKRIQGVE